MPDPRDDYGDGAVQLSRDSEDGDDSFALPDCLSAWDVCDHHFDCYSLSEMMVRRTESKSECQSDDGLDKDKMMNIYKRKSVVAWSEAK